MGSGIRENSFLPQGQGGILQNGKTSRHHPEHRVEACWFARIPWRAAGTPPGRRFRNQNEGMGEKGGRCFFCETSEQQPTGYAAHSDHNSRCNPCVGEGVLLVVAQVLAGKAQQQEGGTRQGTEQGSPASSGP